MREQVINDLQNVKISDLIKKFDVIIKGSESFISDSLFLNTNALIKERKPKKYRNYQLDSELRLQRLRIEARMIKSALKNSIPVPVLFSLNLLTNSLQFEKIEGKNLGTFLFEKEFQSNSDLKNRFFIEFGSIVSRLHNIEIIHGDLTPLNIIVDKVNKIYIIDFGLSYYSNELKDKAMDIFILYGALKIYPQENEELFNLFLQGYKNVIDYESIIEIFNKLLNKGRYK